MDSLFIARLPDITIANGQTESNVLDLESTAHDLLSLLIVAPTTLAETCTIKVSVDGGTTYQTLHNGTSDIAPPLAGKARRYQEMMGATHMKFVAGAAVAADRTFQISKTWK